MSDEEAMKKINNDLSDNKEKNPDDQDQANEGINNDLSDNKEKNPDDQDQANEGSTEMDTSDSSPSEQLPAAVKDDTSDMQGAAFPKPQATTDVGDERREIITHQPESAKSPEQCQQPDTSQSDQVNQSSVTINSPDSEGIKPNVHVDERLDSTNNSMEVELEQTEHQLTQFRRDVKERDETLKRKDQEHAKALQQWQQEIEKLEHNLKGTEKRVEAMKTELDRKDLDHEQTLQKWQQEIKILQEELEQSKKREDVMKADHDKSDRKHDDNLNQILEAQKKLYKEKESVKDKSIQLAEENEEYKTKHKHLAKIVRENYDKAQKQLQIKDDELKKMKESYQKLKTEYSVLEKRLKNEQSDRVKERNKNVEAYTMDINDKKRKLKEKDDTLKKTKQQWEDDKKDLENKLKQEQKDREEERKQNDGVYKKNIDDMHRERDGWYAECVNLNTQVQRYKSQEVNYQQILNQQLHTNEQQKIDLQSLSKQVQSLDQERSTLVLRLSKIAGAKLTTNNANIADLSDENRPTKLAEKFSELYDNEWTDAFEEVCEQLEEDKGVQFMLQLLQRAFSLCKEMSNDHIETLKRSATTINYAPTKRMKFEKQENEIKSVSTQTGNEDDKCRSGALKEPQVQPSKAMTASKETTLPEGPQVEPNNATTASKETSPEKQSESKEVPMDTDHDETKTSDPEKVGENQAELENKGLLAAIGDKTKATEEHSERKAAILNPDVFKDQPTASPQTPLSSENKSEPDNQSDSKEVPMDTGHDETNTSDPENVGENQAELKNKGLFAATDDKIKATEEHSERKAAILNPDVYTDQPTASPQIPLSTENKSEPDTREHTDIDTGRSSPYNPNMTETDVDTGRLTTYKPNTVLDIAIPDALTPEFLKQLLDMRKIIGLQMEELVVKKVTNAIALEHGLDLDKKPLTCIYIRKCVLLCWSMGLKDPPVFMDIITPDKDTKFDTDKYKAYTKTGKRLLFVVWPPLYLHEGGPLLSKGVAQGAKE